MCMVPTETSEAGLPFCVCQHHQKKYACTHEAHNEEFGVSWHTSEIFLKQWTRNKNPWDKNSPFFQAVGMLQDRTLDQSNNTLKQLGKLNSGITKT